MEGTIMRTVKNGISPSRENILQKEEMKEKKLTAKSYRIHWSKAPDVAFPHQP
jgi:hypothetical protein